VGFIPYFPLAGGFLTGKYKRNQPPPEGSRGESSTYVQKYLNDPYFDRLEQLTKWAEDHGKTIGELAHAWLLAQPQVCSVISGGTRPEHFQDNVQSSEWTLSQQDLEEIESIIGVICEPELD
jgi:aryl-alcohol dehydrogenase-like predicted oxidoreductase